MREQRIVRPLLYLAAGLLIWAAHFGTVYAINALACARGFDTASIAGFSAVPAGVSLATLLAVLAIVLTAWAARASRGSTRPVSASPRAARFFDRMALAGAAIGLLAVVWGALPTYLVPPCA